MTTTDSRPSRLIPLVAAVVAGAVAAAIVLATARVGGGQAGQSPTLPNGPTAGEVAAGANPAASGSEPVPPPSPKPASPPPAPAPQPGPASGQAEPAGPVEEPPGPAPAELVVSTNVINMPLGATEGSFTITNAGGEPLNWNAHAYPYFALSDESGSLTGGSSQTIEFTIHTAAFEPGPYTRTIKVFHPGFGGEIISVNGVKVVEAFVAAG